MEDVVLTVFGILMALSLICFIGIFLCKWIYKCYSWIRERIRPTRVRHRIFPVRIQSIPATELHPPSYEEATRQANVLTTRQRRRRRRNHSHDNVTSDNVNNNERGDTDTHLDGESTGDSNNGEGSNDNENNDTRIGSDSGVTINFGEDNVVTFSSRNEEGSKSNAADDSGVKSGSGDDTVDKFDDASISSKYDTASGSSAGGGDSRAMSPWIDF